MFSFAMVVNHLVANKSFADGKERAGLRDHCDDQIRRDQAVASLPRQRRTPSRSSTTRHRRTEYAARALHP